MNITKHATALLVGRVVVGLLREGMATEPWSLKHPIHSAIFVFFLWLYLQQRNDISPRGRAVGT